jgi:hypothetical protein
MHEEGGERTLILIIAFTNWKRNNPVDITFSAQDAFMK